MAYLGNGIYDLLDVVRASANPQITYEGLYQDPPRDDTTYYDGDLKKYPYGLTNEYGTQAFTSSAFPQRRLGEYFTPRVGISPTSGIMSVDNIPTNLNSLPTNMGVANEADVDEEIIEENKTKKSGIERLFETIMGIKNNIPLTSFLPQLNFSGNPTQRFTPGFNYRGLNESMINDAFDPVTGTTRFDRAVPGSFRSFRTLKDYFDSKKNKAPTFTPTPTPTPTPGDGDGGGFTSQDAAREEYGAAGQYR
jgi:hypothetical protein